MIADHCGLELSPPQITTISQNQSNKASAAMSGAAYPWFVLAAIFLLALLPVSASIVVTVAEVPGAVKSSLSHTAVINFSSLATKGISAYSNLTWTDSALGTVGTIDQVFLQKAGQFGGATYPGGYYPVQSHPGGGVGGTNAIPSTTLTFNAPSSYFGIWWSAGDKTNTLTFYNGNTQIAQYTTASFLGLLPHSYYGNPVNAKADPLEPFAFLNFFAVGTQFTKVVFSNMGPTGFESDNWTYRTHPFGYYPGENPATLPGILISPSNSFATWMSTNYPALTGADALPTANPSHDGLSNLVKYALGLDPTVCQSAGTRSGNTMTFTKGAMAKADGNITYSIEESTDLLIWTTPTGIYPSGTVVNGADSISYIFPLGLPEIFMRFRVTQTP